MLPAWARASFRASGFCIPHQDPCFPRPREVKHLAQEHTATDQAFSPLDPTLPLTSVWPQGSYLTSLCPGCLICKGELITAPSSSCYGNQSCKVQGTRSGLG